MRHILLYAFVALFSAQLATAQTPPTPSRSAITVGTVKADESAHIDLVRQNIERDLNDFIGTQREVIRTLNTTVINWSSQVQQLCMLLYTQLNVAGAVFTVPVSVPAPGVVLTPDQALRFCNSVIAIQSPGGGNDPDVRPPFTTRAIPPVCDLRTQDLAWNGTGWDCVTTLRGLCAQPGATPPNWVAVPRVIGN